MCMQKFFFNVGEDDDDVFCCLREIYEFWGGCLWALHRINATFHISAKPEEWWHVSRSVVNCEKLSKWGNFWCGPADKQSIRPSDKWYVSGHNRDLHFLISSRVCKSAFTPFTHNVCLVLSNPKGIFNHLICHFELWFALKLWMRLSFCGSCQSMNHFRQKWWLQGLLVCVVCLAGKC